MSTSEIKLHPYTRNWLNAKIAFFVEILERSELGEEVRDEYKKLWTNRRPRQDIPTRIVLDHDEGYWERWYEARRKKRKRR